MKTSNPWTARWLQFCLLLNLLIVPASRLTAQEAVPTLVTNPPPFGTFYWLSGLPSAPYPFDPARGLLPIWSFNGAYYVDDSELLQELGITGSMMMLNDPPSPGEGGGGGGAGFCNSLTNFTLSYQYLNSTNVSIGIAQSTNPWVALTIQTATTNNSYDVFGTTNLADLALPSLSRTNWKWLMRVSGKATNFSWGETNWCERYFQVADLTDSDNDGMSDAIERLLGTSPTNATSARPVYENIISNQNPSAWFKLNDTNLADAQGGSALTIVGGAWDPDALPSEMARLASLPPATD